jgi:site-specific DNA-cytosine methylase
LQPSTINSGFLESDALHQKETWRLQGFPDWAFERARQVNSDTQLYRQAGNSVSVPVIFAIAQHLK